MSTLRAAAGALLGWCAVAAALTPGDARRGAQVFQSEQCVQCHSLAGTGGTQAPDLARPIDRNYTPAVMASLMWNHAPDMWAGMKKQGIVQAKLSTESAADLFAYFVAARYFEKPGDAGRGKQAFTQLHCAECHGITNSVAAGAPPVAKWASIADPLALAQQMWNHGPRMREEFAKRKVAWPLLTAQNLTDMLVYLRNLPETRGLPREFTMPSGDNGMVLFQSKGCQGCHMGANALESKLHNQTLTEIAVGMWNHQPNMKPVELSEDEMRQIIGYVWTRQYFSSVGNADRGRRVFTSAKCAACHENNANGAPKLTKGAEPYSDVTMISALWDHGPRMLDMMNQQKLAWPRFTAQQMSDLIAYLNTL